MKTQSADQFPRSKLDQWGRYMTWARARAKLTIRELAKLASIPNSSITEIESGDRFPRANTLEKIANALKVSPCWLVFGDGTASDGWEEREQS